MASLKDLRRRIRSTRSMQQIFKAMEMVAAAKLRRAQVRAQSATPYAKKLTEVLANIAGAAAEMEHPLFKARPVQTTVLVVVSSDRGFAGTYNTSVFRVAEQRVRQSPPGTVKLVAIGRKARDYFKRRSIPVIAAHTDLPSEASVEFARRLTTELSELFLSGQADRIEVLFTHFVSALTRRVETEVFLPVGGDAPAGQAERGIIFEPSAEAVFAALVPRYATAKLYAALADALASEHAARMVAMGSARKNAGELVDGLTLTRNRLRQAAITREIAELVGGAEALK